MYWHTSSVFALPITVPGFDQGRWQARRNLGAIAEHNNISCQGGRPSVASPNHIRRRSDQDENNPLGRYSNMFASGCWLGRDAMADSFCLSENLWQLQRRYRIYTCKRKAQGLNCSISCKLRMGVFLWTWFESKRYNQWLCTMFGWHARYQPNFPTVSTWTR